MFAGGWKSRCCGWGREVTAGIEFPTSWARVGELAANWELPGYGRCATHHGLQAARDARSRPGGSWLLAEGASWLSQAASGMPGHSCWVPSHGWGRRRQVAVEGECSHRRGRQASGVKNKRLFAPLEMVEISQSFVVLHFLKQLKNSN